jgi:hypothetical protein
MHDETGTLFIDWVDHFVLAHAAEECWCAVGYVRDTAAECPSGWHGLFHPDALLPRVLIDPNLHASELPAMVALRVDSIADFMAEHGVTHRRKAHP